MKDKTPIPSNAVTVEGLIMPDEGPVGRSIHAGAQFGENGLKIVVAHTAGFCFGVKRAVEMAWKAVEKSGAEGKKAATLGPIIHNPQEVERLEEKGVYSQSDLGGLGEGDLIVIRAHGIPKNERADAKSAGLQVMDATCPYVRRPQMLAERSAREGFLVVIVGDPAHPEIKGVKSFAGDKGVVVRGPDEVSGLPDAEKVAVLVQTTQKREVFDEVVEACRARFPEVKDLNTICDDTTERQADVKTLASEVEVMLVVGGALSANTRKLAEISEHYTLRTHLIERADQVDPSWFDGITTVGIAAGASTPDWLVGDIVKVVGAKRPAADSAAQPD